MNEDIKQVDNIIKNLEAIKTDLTLEEITQLTDLVIKINHRIIKEGD